jgi:uncharacterized membrane protein YdjX (TVP38/TMEM64 family)
MKSFVQHDFVGVRLAVVVAALVVASGCSGAADELVGWLESVADHPLAPLIVVAIFIASGFVAAPLSLIMIPTIVVYGPVFGSLWTAIGATLGGALFFWFGSKGGTLVGRLRKASADRSTIGHLVERNGVVAVAIARNLPLGPYPVVNFALGATPISMPQFLIGNLIGLLPWIAVYALTGAELRALLTDPSPDTLLRFGLTIAAVILIVAAASHLVRRRMTVDPEATPSEDPS